MVNPPAKAYLFEAGEREPRAVQQDLGAYKLALAKALLSGQRGGSGDGGKLPGSAYLRRLILPDPARANCDGQHVLELCKIAATKENPEHSDVIQFAPHRFPDQAPFGALFGRPQSKRG